MANKVFLLGRLTKDVEVKYAASTQMAIGRMTLAIDDGFGEKKKTNFIPVVAFGKTAENCEKFTGKGLRVAVEGKIQTGFYEDKDGKRVNTTDVIADRIEFVDWKGSNNGQIQAEVPTGFAELDSEFVPF